MTLGLRDQEISFNNKLDPKVLIDPILTLVTEKSVTDDRISKVLVVRTYCSFDVLV